jgi:hypothetical protein
MMHGHEKSDLAIVAVKPANKVAPRCGAVRGGVSRSGESRTYGFVRGARGNSRPYRVRALRKFFAASAHGSYWHWAAEQGCPRAWRVLEGKRTILGHLA